MQWKDALREIWEKWEENGEQQEQEGAGKRFSPSPNPPPNPPINVGLNMGFLASVWFSTTDFNVYDSIKV